MPKWTKPETLLGIEIAPARIAGDAIYSYSLKLAHRESDDDALIGRIVLDTDLETARKISVTTARHVKALRVTLDSYNVEIVSAA